MAEFRKKPVVVEAWQYVGASLPDEPKDYQETAQGLLALGIPIEPTAHWMGACAEAGCTGNMELYVMTLEDGSTGATVKHIASVGDFIIKGVQGEFYPCKPDIFAATYEPA